MTEAMGFCEKHQLPLDRNGECELCRLSEMPSKAPPTPSAWWLVLIPFALVIASIAWAMSSWEAEPAAPLHRGVRTTAPQPASPAPPREEFPPPKPEEVPEPPTVPDRETPVPVPGSEGTMLEEPAPRPVGAIERFG
jgi:hypothetical protein